MKHSLRNYLFWLTLGLLVLLLFLQVKWIYYTISFQERVLEKSVALALDKSIALLNADKPVCDALRSCLTCDTTHLDDQLLSHGVWELLENSVREELAQYGLAFDFNLFIIHESSDTLRHSTPAVSGPARYYSQNLREIMEVNGFELVLRTPFRGRFIPPILFSMLGASVILLLLAIVSIIQLVRLYRNELILSGHTRELINNITHEFKTPISTIALAAGMIRKSKNSADQEKLDQYIGVILRENQKLKRQVEGLLTMAAVEWDEFDYHRKPVGLRTLVSEATGAVAIHVEASGGTLQLEDNALNDTIFADPHHMVNAIVNLLTNAINYSANPPEIVLRIYNRNREVVLEVEDKGIGIPSRYHRFLFDTYYRVPTGEVHNIKGFGIGLSYVKRVVDAHGGSVAVDSEPGVGSIFRIVLPLELNESGSPLSKP